MSEPTAFFVIDSEQLARLERVKKRLFTEMRMGGDEMRDAAQAIDGVVRGCRDFPLPEEK
jgi:hypothetical protein